MLFPGKPLPQIHWYRDGNEINAKTNASPDEKDVWSVVILGPLDRDDLNSRIVCKALSHPRVPSIESVVQIDMNCKLTSANGRSYKMNKYLLKNFSYTLEYTIVRSPSTFIGGPTI